MQTSIHNYFKTRKRSAVGDDNNSLGKLSPKKLPTPITEIPVSTENTPTRSPKTQDELKKELSLGEYKKVIRKNKRFSSLKGAIERLESRKECLAQIKEKLDDLNCPKLQEFDNVELQVLSSPIKRTNLKPRRLTYTESPDEKRAKQYVSPRKLLDEDPPKVLPYNKLFMNDKEPLSLPNKYSILKELFKSIDMIIKIKTTREETVTFEKLRANVQKMTGKNFTEEHLGKIKAVYPESYELTRKLIKAPLNNEETYELEIKVPSPKNTQTIKFEFSSDLLLKRKKMFHELLLEETKIHHEQFLKSLDPPIYIDKRKIKRWHPEFDLNKVPDIKPVLIPQPRAKNKRFFSAQKILEKTQIIISEKHRTESSAGEGKNVTSSGIVTSSSKNETSIRDNPLPAFQKALNGIPKSLLEKVRARQAEKMVRKMTQTSSEVKEMVMLSRLPELARIMRTVFVNEKKGVLPEEIVVSKVGHSYKEKLTYAELVEHFQLISKHVPGWMNFCTVRNTSFIRLSKDADLSRIVCKLKKLSQS